MINLTDGSLIDSYDLGGQIVSSAAVGNGIIIIGDSNGMVNAFF